MVIPCVSPTTLGFSAALVLTVLHLRAVQTPAHLLSLALFGLKGTAKIMSRPLKRRNVSPKAEEFSFFFFLSLSPSLFFFCKLSPLGDSLAIVRRLVFVFIQAR